MSGCPCATQPTQIQQLDEDNLGVWGCPSSDTRSAHQRTAGTTEVVLANRQCFNALHHKRTTGQPHWQNPLICLAIYHITHRRLARRMWMRKQTKRLKLLQACNNSTRQRLFPKRTKRFFLVYKENFCDLYIDFSPSIERKFRPIQSAWPWWGGCAKSSLRG